MNGDCNLLQYRWFSIVRWNMWDRFWSMFLLFLSGVIFRFQPLVFRGCILPRKFNSSTLRKNSFIYTPIRLTARHGKMHGTGRQQKTFPFGAQYGPVNFQGRAVKLRGMIGILKRRGFAIKMGVQLVSVCVERLPPFFLHWVCTTPM